MYYHRLSYADSRSTQEHYCECQRGAGPKYQLDQPAPTWPLFYLLYPYSAQMADELCAGLDLLKAGIAGEQVFLIGLAFAGL